MIDGNIAIADRQDEHQTRVVNAINNCPKHQFEIVVGKTNKDGRPKWKCQKCGEVTYSM
jgi:hypothetical protein